MGTVVPFPLRPTRGETASARKAPGNPAEVVILAVIQCVRTPVPAPRREIGPPAESL